MEIYNKLNYDIQNIVIKKIFSENVKNNKEVLKEDIHEYIWLNFDKIWKKRISNSVFDIVLNVNPYEVLLYNKKNYLDITIEIDLYDINRLFYYDEDDRPNENLKYILYGTEEHFTYEDIVIILNDEINEYMKEEFDEQIEIGDHRFLEFIELIKIDPIKNMDTYRLEFFMGS